MTADVKVVHFTLKSPRELRCKFMLPADQLMTEFVISGKVLLIRHNLLLSRCHLPLLGTMMLLFTASAHAINASLYSVAWELSATAVACTLKDYS